ncbi:MAG: hypothetical protein LM580_05640 [Thermofilum sp.]|nr:hypothetical protein [Thermofilum sp.]
MTGAAGREALARRLAGELERIFSDPTATAAQLSFTLRGAVERSMTARLEVPYVCRGFSLVLLSEDRAVISVYSFREDERVDWGALAREILADVEEFTGARVAEVALKAAARP